jgi:hypothetical protein
MPLYDIYEEAEADRMIAMLPSGARDQFEAYMECEQQECMDERGCPLHPLLVKQLKSIYLQDWCKLVCGFIEEEDGEYHDLLDSGEYKWVNSFEIGVDSAFDYIQHTAPLVERYVDWAFHTWAIWNPPGRGKCLRQWMTVNQAFAGKRRRRIKRLGRAMEKKHKHDGDWKARLESLL